MVLTLFCLLFIAPAVLSQLLHALDVDFNQFSQRRHASRLWFRCGRKFLAQPGPTSHVRLFSSNHKPRSHLALGRSLPLAPPVSAAVTGIDVVHDWGPDLRSFSRNSNIRRLVSLDACSARSRGKVGPSGPAGRCSLLRTCSRIERLSRSACSN